MAKYFSLEELSGSSIARQRRIDNVPDSLQAAHLEQLAVNLLDLVRETWDKPIKVTSGFRCPALNRFVGGVASSQHLLGEAADITTGSVNGNRKLFQMIVSGDFDFDQLIDEQNYSWLHISYRAGANRHQILHL